LEWSEHEEVRWNSVIDISLHNTKGNRLTRLFRGKGTTLLRRGYKEDAKVDDGKPNFSDLILVVHGIGQKGYENLIAKNTTQYGSYISSRGRTLAWEGGRVLTFYEFSNF
jgi:hypothetical protein